jgi:hypothetical protein
MPVAGSDVSWKQSLMQAHGCLMILGYWLMSSVAILTARYYKNVWPNKMLFNTPIWFQVRAKVECLTN